MLPEFDLMPSTYQQVTNIIRKMKTSGSPCPLDQISVICFERYPYLRTYLTELIHAVRLPGTIPEEWKKACTILIHKKDNSDSPSNFRPIHYRPRVTYSPLARSGYTRVTRECFEYSFHSLLVSTRKGCWPSSLASLASLAKYSTRFTRKCIECPRVKNLFISTICKGALTCNINTDG